MAVLTNERKYEISNILYKDSNSNNLSSLDRLRLKWLKFQEDDWTTQSNKRYLIVITRLKWPIRRQTEVTRWVQFIRNWLTGMIINIRNS